MSWNLSFSAKASEVPAVLEKLSATYANAERDSFTPAILAVAARAPKDSIVIVEGQGSENFSYSGGGWISGQRLGTHELKIGVYAAAEQTKAA